MSIPVPGLRLSQGSHGNPGLMFVPRKPWPFGNEYHDAGCAQSDIIWSLDLREGKDHPQDLGKKEYDNLGKSVGLLLRLTKAVWGTGKVFVLDSGFCVLKAIIELKKKGLFGATLIKKRCYCPSMSQETRSSNTSMTRRLEMWMQSRVPMTEFPSTSMRSRSQTM